MHLFSFFGLGKSRTKFGKWLDNEELTQIELEEKTGLSRGTISRLCNDKEYNPKISTWTKIQRALKNMGYNVDRDDFFNF